MTDVSRETTASGSSNPGFRVPRETVERLVVFEHLLRRWNARINLVAPASLDDLWRRHIEDSLQLAPWLPKTGLAIDIGSGAGFPGLILALATELPFLLVEADHRKASFLREAARATATNVEIAACRVEAVRRTGDVITARAVAPLSRLLALAAPRLKPSGVCLLLKGAGAAAEISSAEATWRFGIEQHASITHRDGAILRLHGIMSRNQHQTAS